MKNLITPIFLVFSLMFCFSTVYAQQYVDDISIIAKDGILFNVLDSTITSFTDTSTIKCHPNDSIEGNEHPIYLRFEASVNSSTPYNDVILAKEGLLGIGLEDPCLRYHEDISPVEDTGVKLYLHSGTARKQEGGSEWEVPSDIRLKKNIVPFTDGLEVIRKINPISYEYNGKANTIDGAKAVGVSAQEMAKIAPYTVHTSQQRLEPKDPVMQSVYTYNGSALRFVIINALKEIAEENEKLDIELEEMTNEKNRLKTELEDNQAEINTLKEEMNDLKNMVNLLVQNDAILSNKTNKTAYFESKDEHLQQNQPNPFKESTIIQYVLPEHTQFANIVFTNSSGKEVYNVSLDKDAMRGEIKFNPGQLGLQKGIYFYSLVVDDKTVASKKLIFQ